MKSFGVGPRESYNSEAFYARRLYEAQTQETDAAYVENPVPPATLNKVLLHDSRDLHILPDCSLHLIVTSPPYNVGKDYDANLSLRNYLDLLSAVFTECRRVLVPGGRACINVANLGRRPYVPLHRYIMEIMDSIGFLMRGEIIWDKAASAGTSTAWGSWKSATNPTLRDVHEYILVFSKDTFRRERSGRTSTISEDEFLAYTKSIWSFPAESAKRVQHPAPFPVELPYRLIQLYTFGGDVVLDPFAGSGSTAIAALEAGRNFVLFDTSNDYVEIARARVQEFETVRSRSKQRTRGSLKPRSR
jgi:site-specific DNA-methyltransferase (adenine-specific)